MFSTVGYNFSAAHHTLFSPFNKMWQPFSCIAPSQNALFNYGKPERAVVEKENTVGVGIWSWGRGEVLGRRGVVWT